MMSIVVAKPDTGRIEIEVNEIESLAEKIYEWLHEFQKEYGCEPKLPRVPELERRVHDAAHELRQIRVLS